MHNSVKKSSGWVCVWVGLIGCIDNENLIAFCQVLWAHLCIFVFTQLIPDNPRANLRGGCRGWHPPPPRDDLRFFNTTGILQKKTMWFIGVEVEQETSAPPPKKNPGSAPVIGKLLFNLENNNISNGRIGRLCVVAAIIATSAAMNPQTRMSQHGIGSRVRSWNGPKNRIHRYSNDLPMYSMGNAGTNDSLMFQSI